MAGQKFIGDEGTEQFTVTTWVSGKQIGCQKIHDPFVRTRVALRGFRHAWNALTKGIVVEVNVDGTHGAIASVMTLDPGEMERMTAEHLEWTKQRRLANDQAGVVGYVAEAKHVR